MSENQDDTDWPLITAILFALEFFTGVSAVAGLILAYMKKDEAEGTYAESIYIYLIHTFWMGFAIIIIGLITSFILIGIFILFAGSIWFLIRVVNAAVKAKDKKPIDNPRGFFI